MRCVVIEQFGNPSQVLGLGERPQPVPGPGEIRIRMIMSPIHNHDLAIVRGVYGYKPPLPAVPGTEAVGRVDALGGGVTQLKPGQRVTLGGASATWAEYFVAKAASAVPLPDTIPDETACQLIAMPLSSMMLLEDLDLKAGDWLIQNAANGAVGKIVDTVGTARGVNVINLVRRDAAVAGLKALGARHVVSTESAGWPAQVTTLTGGAPVTRAVDSIGGTAANDLMNVLAYGGVLMSFGAMSMKPLQIDVGNLIFKQATLKGFWGSKRRETTSPADLGRMIGELVRLAATGTLKLGVEARFDLAHAGAAAAASDQPGRGGKVVLTA